MGAKRLGLDACALFVFLLVANPTITGIDVHEWLGLGSLVAFVAHVAGSAVFAKEAGRKKRKRSAATTANRLIDTIMLITMMTCVVSGLMVSGAVLQTLGLYAHGYYFWDPLHAITAKLFFALILVHLVLHWPAIAQALPVSRKE